MKRQLKNFFQYLYLNKMELSQPFKKRYLLGIWNWGCRAAGFCIAGSRADKATNQRETDNFLIHRSTIQKNFNFFT